MKCLDKLKGWLRRKFASSPRSRHLKRVFQLEQLEDRLAPAVGDLLPDLVTWADQSRGYLYGWFLDTTTMPGHTLLRLSQATANQGAGRLELRGGAINPDGTQQVFQRIYNQDGSFRDVLAGNFENDPDHHHIHFEDFAQYNLRAVTSGGGVGGIIAGGLKTTFAVIDTSIYNSSLPGFSSSPFYTSAGQVQGLSVGWADVYPSNLENQWIDVTGVAPGTYWLESVTDPDNRIVESNDGNNVTRIMITLGTSQVDGAGNTLATARDIGALSTSQTFHDFVSPTDTND